MSRRAALVLVCLLGAGLSLAAPAAAETKDYAYLLVQGRISDPAARNPMAGATIRLSSDEGTFEAVTDRNGVFVFDKLPVASYDVNITDAEGKVVRSARQIAPGDPDRSRVELRMGRHDAMPLRLDPADDRVALAVPDPPPNWKRFWKQAAIFLGVAVALAL